MRRASDRNPKNLPGAPARALRLAVVGVGIGLVMTAGVVRAQEAEDDRTIDQKIMDTIMSGIGATNMDNRGIDYRERSPLVVPPKLDLPPPVAATKDVKAPNWPKDPDEARRKAAIAARKKAKPDWQQANMPVSRAELDAGKPLDRSGSNDPVQPGNPLNNQVLSPQALGFDGRFSDLFGSSKQVEAAPFKGEPTRESLTQPPTGYQTPSPNYAYGLGSKGTITRQSDPLADSVAGKSGN
jgi:hypothetical protein